MGQPTAAYGDLRLAHWALQRKRTDHALQIPDNLTRQLQVETLSPAMAAKVRKAFVESIWALGDKCCGEDAAALHKLALDAGLTQ